MQERPNQVERLQAELLVSERRLNDALSDVLTANAELRGSNDEQQALNEELRVANEELEASETELQSLNGRLEGRVDALAEANSDMRSVIESTQIAIVFLEAAYERLVHLLLEFHSRLDAVGMVDGDTFSLPLTQEVLADALGLSVVHINPTLQQVRRDRLLELRGGQVTLRQPELMRAMADWPPSPAR